MIPPIIPHRNYSSVDNIMRRANSVHSVNGEASNGSYRYRVVLDF